MDIQQIGRIVMMLIGAFLVVRASLVSIRRELPRYAVSLAVGGLLVGTGTFGLPFMDKYRGYFDSLVSLTSQGTSEAYAKFYADVASGELPPEIAEVGIAYTLERPLPGMADQLNGALEKAQDSSRRELLERARVDLEAKESAAADIVGRAAESGDLSIEALERYDPGTRRLMVEPIENLPPEQLQRFRIDPGVLREMRRAGNTR